MKHDTFSHNSQSMDFNLSSINLFWEKFNVKTILNRSNIRKLKGVHPIIILTYILALPFLGKTFYQGIVQNPNINFKKDTAYSFSRSEKYNWRKFILILAEIFHCKLTQFFHEN